MSTTTLTNRFPTNAQHALATGILYGYEQEIPGPEGSSYLYPDGSVLLAETGHWQALMGDPAKPDEWRMPLLEQTAQGHWTWPGAWWQYIPQGPGWTFVPVPEPEPAREPIVPSDWDAPDAVVGDEEDHCYVNVGHGPDGWYVTVSLDCNTGSFSENLTEDDGPYESYDAALAAGKDAAADWCCGNDIYWQDDAGRLDGITVGSSVWVKPDRRAMDAAVRAVVLAWDQRERVADLRYEDGRTEEEVSFDLVRGIDTDRDF